MKSLLFVCEFLPQFGAGSRIVIRRHLLRLEQAGWKIVVVAAAEQLSGVEVPESWIVIGLPRREWWWPPSRGTLTFSHSFRLRLQRRVIERHLRDHRPDLILSLLEGRYPLLALELKRRWDCPLGVLVHDEREYWFPVEARDQVVRESERALMMADRIWVVSPELADLYQRKTSVQRADAYSTLLPIPEGGDGSRVSWKPGFTERPVVVHAGMHRECQRPMLEMLAEQLARLGGELLLVGPSESSDIDALPGRFPNIRRMHFPTNRESLELLRREASAAAVVYSLELAAQPWCVGSFPSKFLEVAHLGLPQLIIAPPGTAIHNWCRSHEWPLLVDHPAAERLGECLSQLTQESRWQELAWRSQSLAEGEFHPDRIHAQFERELPVRGAPIAV